MNASPTFKLSMFSKRVGDAFRLRVDEQNELGLKLIEAVSTDSKNDREPTQFSILFLDPAGTAERYLPQAIYCLEHAEMGQLDLFLVPIGPGADGTGMQYESVFNNLPT